MTPWRGPAGRGVGHHPETAAARLIDLPEGTWFYLPDTRPFSLSDPRPFPTWTPQRTSPWEFVGWTRPAESPRLRQAQPLFIYLDTLADACGLLARLAELEEPGPLLDGAIEVLRSAKACFQALQTVQSRLLISRVDSLLGVLRHLYRPAP